MVVSYIPQAGDVVWITLDPTLGREQRGRRPALVVSWRTYNKPSGLCWLVPITSRAKGYPFEVILSGGTIEGVVLSDQLRTIDWRERQVEYIESVESHVIDSVRSYISLMIQKS